MSSEHMDLLRRYLAIYNAGAWDQLEDVLTSDYRHLRIPVKAISQSGVFDHPRSEAAKRPTRGLGSLPDDHLLSMCCG